MNRYHTYNLTGFFKGVKYTFGLLLVVLLIGFFSPGRAQDSESNEKVFRVAIQNSIPKYLPTNMTGEQGLCDMIYGELKRRLAKKDIKLEVVTSPTSIKRILRGLEVGMVDGFCGAGRNSEREKLYHYSKIPVFHNNIVIVAHENDENPPKDLKDLIARGETIMAFYGTTGAERLRKIKGVKVDDRFLSLFQPMNLIATKKRYKYFYYHELAVAYMIKKNNLPLQVIDASDEKLPQWMSFSKKFDPALRAIVDETLMEMHKDKTLAKFNKQFSVY